ncbi:hypothetical protein OAN307_c16470 [Octadecabacter antarcticus 307]|uniref:Uncharacterized protein n=1 Tax=Octadecabacter antarcticus 307 TaxID=391626 RepID=M9R6C6_9RHOB|nr:hypothetical protein OAN307_c16470 [Octadecabacter antarcticus 307]
MKTIALAQPKLTQQFHQDLAEANTEGHQNDNLVTSPTDRSGTIPAEARRPNEPLHAPLDASG